MGKIAFAGETYHGRVGLQNAQDCINWYPETDNAQGKYPVVLYPVPGKTTFADLGTQPIRGMLSALGKLYVVSGPDLYEVGLNGNFALVGSVTTSVGNVSMAANITQIILVDGTAGYTYTPSTSTFATIPSTAVGVYDHFPSTATHVKFMDGYFFVNDPANAGRFYRSELYNGQQWQALSYATAQRSPDALHALAVIGKELLLIGETTTEPWYNEGTDLNNPMVPLSSVFINKGILAPFSIANSNNFVLWLSQDEHGQGTIIATDGARERRVSNYSIEQAINKYGDLTDAIGFVYHQLGHEFYEISFPSGNATWVYDLIEDKWHRRKTRNSGRHEVQWSAYLNGNVLVGSATDGRILILDTEIEDDDGEVIERVRVTQGISDEQENKLHHACVKLDMEVGVGNTASPAPVVRLSWSDNGGKTWSNPLTRSLGAMGEYNTEVFYKQLGRAKNRIYKIEVTDKVKTSLLGGYVEVHSGIKSTRDNPIE